MSHTIGVDNSGVITSLLVKDHPEWMWYREGIQNALEATKTYISQNSIESADIKVRKLHLKGLIEQDGLDTFKNKLCVLNFGGMTATELVKALKLGGSGKTASLNANYGVGIKTSVLNWSDLLIITYKDGKGHFAWLGKEYTNGIDFNIVAYSDDGQGYPIEECTDWIKSNAKERDYDLNHDFTEVVILGQEVNQDTYLNTFGFGPDGEERKKVNASHIKENLCKRYFRLPENIRIKIDPTANNEAGDKGSTVNFMTFVEAFEKAQANPKITMMGGEAPRVETVTTSDGVKIHYFWDGPCGEAYSSPKLPSTEQYLQSWSWPVAFSGFVWRDEVYDPQVNTHRKWKTVAFRLGIQDNFSYFRIFVEMPDRAVTTDKYRATLQTGSGELAFDSDENLYMIMANMPEWYKEKTKETKKDLKTDLDEALRDMFARYMELDRPLIGKPSINQGPVSKRTQGQGNNQSAKSKGGKGSVQKNFKNPQFNQPDVPAIREATDDEIKQWQIKDNFGYLIEKGGDSGRDLLIYNPHYKSIEKIASLSVSKLPDPEQYFETAKEKAKEHLILNSALWVMICRSRIAQEKMTLDEFGVSTSSDFLDTYIFARELQVSEDVARFVEKQKRQNDKVITSDNDINDLETRLVAAGGRIPKETV
jgi:hypothetical protein